MKHRAAVLGSSGGLWATKAPETPLTQLQRAQEAQQKHDAAGGAVAQRQDRYLDQAGGAEPARE